MRRAVGLRATTDATVRAVAVTAWRGGPCGPCPARSAASCARSRCRRPGARLLRRHVNRHRRRLANAALYFGPGAAWSSSVPALLQAGVPAAKDYHVESGLGTTLNYDVIGTSVNGR